jgi:hypothetical protein
MFLYFKFNYICSDNLLTSMMHATMALTDMLRMSYEPPRMGRPPARERRVACGEVGDAPFGLPSSTKTSFLCVAPPPEALKDKNFNLSFKPHPNAKLINMNKY